jgi:ubiquinone/menaquinone biosynthesis C-methylase UbiE
MRILCDSLVAMGLLQKENGTYSNTPEGSFFLDKKSPAYMGTVARFLCTPEMVNAAIMGTADCVRQGRTMLPGQGTVDPENPVWVSFAEAMAPMMMPAAQAIAAQLPSSGPLKVLDIAAGHGLFGITIAQRNPEAQIVALDWRAVLEVAMRNANGAGVADRYSTIAGSAFDVDFGSAFDVILITNFLHHFSPETNKTLLRKVHAALKPGGRAITLEFVPDDSRVSPPPAARFALTMLTSTAEGDAYTFAELSAMAQNAGFAGSTQIPLHAGQSVIISTK